MLDLRDLEMIAYHDVPVDSERLTQLARVLHTIVSDLENSGLLLENAYLKAVLESNNIKVAQPLVNNNIAISFFEFDEKARKESANIRHRIMRVLDGVK